MFVEDLFSVVDMLMLHKHTSVESSFHFYNLRKF